jgi:glutamine amidotransferase
VTVVDYGVGNLLSVKRGLEKCGASVEITSSPKQILSADKVVFPGVGAFPNAMLALEELKLIEVMLELAELKKPILAICLGMQLLMEQSDEFRITKGLGIIPGVVTKIPNLDYGGLKLKIPHIGWNQLVKSRNEESWNGTVLEGTETDESVYFVHSYMVVPRDEKVRVADTIYGENRISAVIARDQIVGCQFHPEKSGKIGLKILENFILQ